MVVIQNDSLHWYTMLLLSVIGMKTHVPVSLPHHPTCPDSLVDFGSM